jgi:hypothetical protein
VYVLLLLVDVGRVCELLELSGMRVSFIQGYSAPPGILGILDFGRFPGGGVILPSGILVLV